MQFSLKNFQFHASLSEETNAFTATVVVNDISLLHAKNSGHGGCTFYSLIHPTNEKHRKLLQEAEAYCKAQPEKVSTLTLEDKPFTYPNTLEVVIDELVDEAIGELEKKKFEKKRVKAYARAIVYGSATEYREYGFTQKRGIGKVTVQIADVLNTQQGRDVLRAAIVKIKASLKEGEKIWNDNIPADLLEG